MSLEERNNRINKIENFIEEAGYSYKITKFNNLQLYCDSQYEIIKAMCKENKNCFT